MHIKPISQEIIDELNEAIESLTGIVRLLEPNCEHCGDTGVYENEDGTEQPCVCAAEDATNEEMIKGGETQHDSNL